MASQTTVHGHSYQHFENLQMSAKEFYTLLREMIEDYQYPKVTCDQVHLKETGMFSSSREYLKISKGRYNYYVCASPFGKSFFISWWFEEEANTAANVASKFGAVGKAVANRMESKTFYEMDTETMFTSSITSIIKAAVSKVMADKGYRKEPTVVTT